MLVALPGSVLITTKVPELAFVEPSLHYQQQEDKAMWRWCAFLGNVSVTMQDLIYRKKFASWNFNESNLVRVEII